MLECSNILTGCNERFMRENTLYRYRRDSTYTAASVPSDTICATRGTRKKGRYGRSRRSSPQSRSLRGCGVAAWELGRARFTLVRSAAVTPLARRQDCVFSQSCLDKAFGFILRLSYGDLEVLVVVEADLHFAPPLISSRIACIFGRHRPQPPPALVKLVTSSTEVSEFSAITRLTSFSETL